MVKRLREVQGLSVKGMALLYGVGHQSLRNAEHGVYSLTPDAFQSIAMASEEVYAKAGFTRAEMATAAADMYLARHREVMKDFSSKKVGPRKEYKVLLRNARLNGHISSTLLAQEMGITPYNFGQLECAGRSVKGPMLHRWLLALEQYQCERPVLIEIVAARYGISISIAGEVFNQIYSAILASGITTQRYLKETGTRSTTLQVLNVHRRVMWNMCMAHNRWVDDNGLLGDSCKINMEEL